MIELAYVQLGRAFEAALTVGEADRRLRGAAVFEDSLWIASDFGIAEVPLEVHTS